MWKKKAAPKSNLQVHENKEEEKKSLAPVGDIVIPMQGTNRWKAVGKEKETEKPKGTPQNGNHQPKTLDEIAAQALIKEGGAAIERVGVEKDVDVTPILMQNAVPGLDQFDTEDAKVKHDVSLRPETASLEDYERVPIDKFGKGMLLGMGWKPGAPIGKTNKQVVEPMEFLSRPSRLGLGAKIDSDDLPGKQKKFIKPGESREVPQQMRVAPDATGHVRHFKYMSDRLVPVHSMKLRNNALVHILEGPHRDLYGRVQDFEPGITTDAAISIKLQVSEARVVCARPEFNILDEHALPRDHPAFSKDAKPVRNEDDDPFAAAQVQLKALKRKAEDEKEREKEEFNKERESSRLSKKSKKEKERDRPEDELLWVRPHIRVRIVSKSLEGGKYYGQKAKVLDVVDRYRFTVMMENGVLVEGVKERNVETIIPRPGGHVLLVKGKKKGEAGKLLERMTKEGRAVVQLENDLSVLEMQFEEISESAVPAGHKD